MIGLRGAERFVNPVFGFGFACAGVALAGSAWAAGPPTEIASQTFADRTSVVVIEVPVEVTVSGQPVRGLTKENFVVEVDGKAIPIDGFDEVDLGTESVPTLAATGGQLTAPPPAGRRRILFLFDLSNNSVAAITKAKESADQVLGKLSPTDLVGVGTFSRAKGMSLLLHYSPDRAQVAESLAMLGNGQPVMARDPLKILSNFDPANSLGYAGDASAVAPGAGSANRFDAMKAGNSAGWDQLQRMLDQASVTKAASETISTYKQMEQLGEMCRTVDGRKHVVFFSAGLDDDVLAGTSDDQRRTNISRTANESGELWKVDSEEYFGSSAASNSLESLIEVLQRGECVVHTVDTGGLRAGGGTERAFGGGSSGLHALADGTGGSYLENFNKFDVAVGEMLERTRVSYLLSFSRPEVKPNGKFHKIEVDVKGVQGRARVTHRPGFFAPDAKKGTTAVAQVLDLGARLFDDRRPGELVVRSAAWPWVAAQPTPLRHVPLVVELDAPADVQAVTPIDLFVYAFDADSQARDVIAQRFAYDPKAGASGLKAMLPVLLPPGDFVLRIMAREPTSGRTGLSVLPLHVPASPRALLVPEEIGFWQISRATRKDLAVATSHPFAFGDAFFSPALVASVEAPGTLPLVAIGVEPEEGRIVDDHQKEIAKVILGDESVKKSPDGLERRAFHAKLPALPPGTYRLEVDGVQVPFRVVPQPPHSRLIDMTASVR